MTRRVTVIVPTRGRPDNARRLIRAFEETRVEPNTLLILGVDNDDPALGEYIKLGSDIIELAVLVGARLRLGGTLNQIANSIAFDHTAGDLIGFMGDDHVPRTRGWDALLLDSATPGAVLYGDDLFQGPNLPTAVFIGAPAVQALGYFVPLGLTHLFFDNAWKDWGEAAGTLRYLPHIVIEHMHPHAGKAESDTQYTEVNSSAMWSHDETRYNEYKASGEFDADVAKIRAL